MKNAFRSVLNPCLL